MKSVLSLVSIFLVLLATSRGDILCPSIDLISPCTCGTSSIVTCMGDQVTQDVVNNLFNLVRLENQLSAHDWLNVSITIKNTRLSQIDLTPLLFSFSSTLRIEDNVDLIGFTAPVEAEGQIISHVLELSRNVLTDSGISGLFLTLDGPTVKYIMASDNKFQDSPDRPDFLPGLAKFDDMRTFVAERNMFKAVHYRQFYTNRRLVNLILSLNEITEIKEAAFELAEPLNEDVNVNLRFQLSANKISEENLTTYSGWQANYRPKTVSMIQNNLAHLPQNKFENYLLEEMRNVLNVQDNHFSCNKDMIWLRDGKELFQGRVNGVICQNDPEGLDIFNTELDLINIE